MNVLIGAYSQIAHGVPVPVFERALNAVFKPLLTHLHHSQAVLQLSLGVPVLEWLETNHPSVMLLMADLARSGKLELLTGSYNQSILSLLSPKDRSNQIEMTTTYLRKRFGQRSKTLFSYGQIFSPLYINTMNLCCVDSIVISCHDVEDSKRIFTEPFLMQEMGKSITVLPTDDVVSQLLSRYAQKELGFAQLLDKLRQQLSADSGYRFAMLNLDHLLQGGISEEQTNELCSLLFSFEGSALDEVGLSEELPRKGYLRSGWYGFDSVRDHLDCINDLLVEDESLSYLYGRYITMVEVARTYRKDKDVRKRLEQLIQKMSSGASFVCDANASMLRSSVRKLMWRYISEADCVLSSLKDFTYPVALDFDNDQIDEYLVIGKYLSCVVDAKGGSLAELTYLPSLYNYGDAFSPLAQFGSSAHILHPIRKGEKQRLFTDVFLPINSLVEEYAKQDGTTCLDLGQSVYDLTVMDRKSTEYRLTSTTGHSDLLGGEIGISKHFKLRQNTVLLDITLTNLSDHEISCIYGCEIPLCVASNHESVGFIQLENKKNSVHEAAEIMLDNVKSIRIFDEPNCTSLTLVSDTRFTLLKEDYTIEISTILGDEKLYQHTLFMASWPIHLECGEERKFTLGLRVERK